MAEIPDADHYRSHNSFERDPDAGDSACGNDSASEPAAPVSPGWLVAGLVLLALLAVR